MNKIRSLLIPCYNASSYLESLRNNIDALEKPFDEILLYDDASQDDTVSKAKKLGFSIIEGKVNKGPSFARNRLAEAASGEWIHFHDVDDEMKPHYLVAKHNFVSANFDVVLCDSDWILEDTRQIEIARKYNQQAFTKSPVAAAITYPVGVLSGLIRKSMFQKAGGFREDIRCWEDSDLFVRMAGLGARFKCLEEVLVYSIRHGRGISKNQIYCKECRLKLLKEYYAQFGSNTESKSKIFIALQSLAADFLYLKKVDKFIETIHFANSNGGDLPLTHNPLMRFAKKVGVSRSLLFRLQNRIRTNSN